MGGQVAIVAPPVLDLAVVGDAQLEIARLKLVGGAIVALDHAVRGGGKARDEDLARSKGRVGAGIVITAE